MSAYPSYGRRQSKNQFTNIVSQGYEEPPSYKYNDLDEEKRWKPNTWSRKCWIITAAIVVIVLIIVIVVAVEVTKANRYPNYSALSYNLAETYSGESFFDNFDYFSGYDPASGFVHYAAQPAALALNLTYATATSAILKVDTSDTDTTTGRVSARVQSKNTYNNGLFVFDVIHSPVGCSLWPALWLTDPANWPAHGEIDLMEATNTATKGNQVTLHTDDNCKMNVKRKETGKSLKTNCFNETNSNAGCGVQAADSTFGTTFNENGGGLMALEWRDAGIRTWFFDRSSIPADLSSLNTTSGTPDPSTWGEALADFPSTNCDVSSHFKNQSIIANIDLCGQLAGLSQFYTEQSNCPGTCVNYVSTEPGSAYSEAYWEFGGFYIYQAA